MSDYKFIGKINETPSLMTLSVLVTRDEYGDAFIYRKNKQSKTTPILTLLIGTLLICFGVVGIFLNSSNLDFTFSTPVGFTLIISGIGGVIFSQFLLPLMYRGEAANEYDSRTDLQFATIYEFKGCGGDCTNSGDRNYPAVRIKNGWVEGEIPISYITQWIETPTFVLFSASRGIECAIPKRLLDDRQKELLIKLLTDFATNATVY